MWGCVLPKHSLHGGVCERGGVLPSSPYAMLSRSVHEARNGRKYPKVLASVWRLGCQADGELPGKHELAGHGIMGLDGGG